MQLKKVASLFISLAILSLVVFASFQAAKQPGIRKIKVAFKDKVGILLDNLSELISPARRRPLTTIELEENLKANLPVPFTNFNQDDWEWFWHLLYGRFTEDSNGWPRRTRQLSRQEIQSKVVDYYYRPFGSFGQRQWDIFWQQILKGKVF